MRRVELYTVRRKPNWLGLFQEEFRRRADMPFAWGEHDCATAVVAMVEAMTGVNVFSDLEHTNEEHARQVLRRRRGLRRMARDIAKENRFAKIAPQYALRGDVLVVQGKKRERLLGIVGPRVDTFIVAADPGWKIYSLEKAIAEGMILDCFRVPM